MSFSGIGPMHVVSWAKRFLFRTEQLDLAVDRLSGGERARVQIARLMLQPADVLMLDEPTNDLDINTLEVLEQNLMDFTGALVLVTHDRYMLDRVSTVVLGLDGKGNPGFSQTTRSGNNSDRSAQLQKNKNRHKSVKAATHTAKKTTILYRAARVGANRTVDPSGRRKTQKAAT